MEIKDQISSLIITLNCVCSFHNQPWLSLTFTCMGSEVVNLQLLQQLYILKNMLSTQLCRTIICSPLQRISVAHAILHILGYNK